MAVSLFSQSFFEQLRLHAHLGIHLLQPPVLVFQGLHLADHRGIHATVFGSPFVERRRAHSMLPAQIWHGHAAFRRSEEHTSELQSRENLVCRLLLAKTKEDALAIDTD